ncbi:MAG: hypothetical protein ACI952_002212, partial [Flavobacteriales bacterium]
SWLYVFIVASLAGEKRLAYIQLTTFSTYSSYALII